MHAGLLGAGSKPRTVLRLRISPGASSSALHGALLRGSEQGWAARSLVWRGGERAMWFGSIPRMNAALSATQEPMSVPGDMTSPMALLFRFGLLFLPGGQLPPRTMLSRFGLPRPHCDPLAGTLLRSDIARMQESGPPVAEGACMGRLLACSCHALMRWSGARTCAKPPS